MDNKVIDGTVVNKKLLMLLLAAVPGAIFADVTLYGQVNRALNLVDDGHETNTYFVDNDSSNTRFGLTGESALDDHTMVGGKIELGVTSASNATVNQRGNTATSISIRHADTWMDTCFGKFSLGHGSMASDDAAETNLANTWNTAYSYADAGAGMYFHTDGSADPVAGTEPQVSAVIDNFDNGRKPRLRYDTPEFAGFKVAMAIGANGTRVNNGYSQYDSDIALTYAKQMNSVELAAALGYDKKSHAGGARSVKNLVFSASMLHMPSGMSLSFSTGKQHKATAGSENAEYVYFNLGKQAELNNCGKTYFAVDYYNGTHMNADHDKSKHYGFGVEQDLDKVNSTAYAAVRTYKYKTQTVNYDSVDLFTIGWKIKMGAKIA